MTDTAKNRGNSMDARTQIADKIWNVTDEGTFATGTDAQGIVSDATEAILAAMHEILRADPSILRGMVKPLVWELIGDFDYKSGEYSIWLHQARPTPEPVWILFLPDQSRTTYTTLEAAKAAANDHHASAVLAAMGVV